MPGYYVTKYDTSFETLVAMSTNGMDFTLHLDKAHRFTDLDKAIRESNRDPAFCVSTAAYAEPILRGGPMK